MPFPQSWADRLFAQLRLRYGAAMDALFAGQDLRQVAADWAAVLDGWEAHPDAIRWALDNLPERAPNAIAFRNLCRSAPQIRAQALPEPAPKADPQRVAEIVATARAGAVPGMGRSPVQVVIDGIVSRLDATQARPGRAQRDVVRTMARALQPSDPRRADLIRLGFSGIEAATADGAAA